MLGKLTGEDEADRRLDLAGRERLRAAVRAQFCRLRRNALEQVVYEGVHDTHGLRRHAGIGVNLLEHLVDEKKSRKLE